MRLSKQQIGAFISAIPPYLINHEKVELRLYGSRVDDSLKGGDIDLLIVTQSEKQRHQLSLHKAEILASIYRQIEEEKIDLTICNITSPSLDPFIERALKNSILLQGW